MSQIQESLPLNPSLVSTTSNAPARFCQDESIQNLSPEQLEHNIKIAQELGSEFALSPQSLSHTNNLIQYKPAGSEYLDKLLPAQKLSYQQQCQLAIQLVTTLKALHQKGWAFCSLNPSWVLVEPKNFRVKLFNFANAVRHGSCQNLSEKSNNTI